MMVLCLQRNYFSYTSGYRLSVAFSFFFSILVFVGGRKGGHISSAGPEIEVWKKE